MERGRVRGDRQDIQAAAIGGLAGYLDTAIVSFLLLLGAALALFSAERVLWMAYLMAQVRLKWYTQGKTMVFCPSDDPLIREITEDRLLPRIEDVTVVVPMPDSHGWRRRGAGLPERLLMAFKGDALPPFAIVFKPYFSYERVEFGDAIAALADGRESPFKKREARVRELAAEFRERMSVYI